MKTQLHKVVRGGSCAILAAIMLISAAGCSQKAVEAVASAPDIPVQVQKPKKGTLTQSSEFIGTVEPSELVSVIPKMAGTATKVNFKVGDTVKKGDILFEVDSVDVELSLAAQRASLDAAQAGVMTAQAQVDQQLGSGFDLQVAQLETQVESAKKQYSSARQSLRDYNDGKDVVLDDLLIKLNGARDSLPLLEGKKNEADRICDEERTKLQQYREQYGEESDLYKTQKKVADQAERNKISASNLLKDTESTVSMLSANINDADDADANARQLRTAVSNAQLAYDSSNTIYELTKGSARSDAFKVANASLKQATAAFEAQVKSYEAAAHQLTYTQTASPIDGIIEACNVYENAMVMQQNAAFVISDKTAVAATFYVSSDAVRQMEVGDKVKIESGNEQFNGTLTEVGSMVDVQMGLFKVKAAVDDGSSIMTGVSVKIIAETDKAVDSLLIPQSAVHYESGNAYVYVHQDGAAVKTFIQTGVANNEVVEVTSGMTADSELIVTWNPNLRDGAVVTIKTEETAQKTEAAQEEQA